MAELAQARYAVVGGVLDVTAQHPAFVALGTYIQIYK